MTGPALTGVITVDLSGWVDRSGMFTAKAGYAAWKMLAACPAGASVRLHVGALRSIAGSDLLYQLDSSGIMQAGSVEVSGTEPDGVRDVLAGLARMRDGR